eukprot:TRINITY_DN106045_c0_g1_i1.p1 TRINITY_DN106045_c0_g1~~TRINITY_DN106045_c0_g1_i1.p1  ORF type:complete len:448 (-),score=50.56 TRINITY_DN106045_c0_g1_i1:230-1534(-)
MEFARPIEWAAMLGDDCLPAARDWRWLTAFETPDVPEESIEHSIVASMVRGYLPQARIVQLERVQHRGLWRSYSKYRDDEIKVFNEGDANERYLFHGTCQQAPREVLNHQEGLDPRFSSGGFYGCAVYFSESPCYQIGGRYAHRIHGSGGERMQLLIVRVALGTPQDLGTRVDHETQTMKMPGKRLDGRSYNSVRAGPHRPFLSGPGAQNGEGDDSSIIYCVYNHQQMYPQYIVTLGVPLPHEADAICVDTPTVQCPMARMVQGAPTCRISGALPMATTTRGAPQCTMASSTSGEARAAWARKASGAPPTKRVAHAKATDVLLRLASMPAKSTATAKLSTAAVVAKSTATTVLPTATVKAMPIPLSPVSPVACSVSSKPNTAKRQKTTPKGNDPFDLTSGDDPPASQKSPLQAGPVHQRSCKLHMRQAMNFGSL